ncbi:hypothetical protein HMN09_00155900 [Mycena chlorophos]|uniref:GPI anchored protein n=1 Tax=Mycena chlorophos TaxID=658473 RepID=A0A8H6TPD9_MYCCL|nr:hypothetical protein HMN09_00155900 [Mycena chlorophos]
MSRLAFVLSSALIAANLAAAAPTPDLVTLMFPVADTEPLSAVVLGVDASGHTTYEVEALATMDGSTLSSFTATATVVAGSDYLSVGETAAYAPASAMVLNGLSCSMGSDGANCEIETLVSANTFSTITASIPVASLQNEVLDVAVNSTGSAAGSTNSGASSPASSGATTTASSGATSDASSAGQPSPTKSSAVGMKGGIGAAMTIAALIGTALMF